MPTFYLRICQTGYKKYTNPIKMPENTLIYYSTACQAKSIDNFIYFQIYFRLSPARKPGSYLSLQMILPLDKS